jgi:uncharacterized membrane protein YfcA
MEITIIFIFAIIFSAFGTIVGFGGGIFMLPFLIIFFRIPINVAAGSVILALLPGSLISTYFNAKAKKIDYLAGVALEVPTIIGTVFGSLLTAIIPVIILDIAFAFFVSGIGIYTLKKGFKDNIQAVSKNNIFFRLNRIGPRVIKKTETGAYRISFFVAVAFGMMAGMMAGMFGVGGGFLKTPMMVNIFNIPPSVAAATSLFMIFFTSLTGSFSHYMLGHINFTYSTPIIVGFIVGSFVGNHLNLKLSERFLVKLIGIGLIFAGFAVLLNTIFIKQIM